MNAKQRYQVGSKVSAGCHINDVMNNGFTSPVDIFVSAGCHINDVMNKKS